MLVSIGDLRGEVWELCPWDGLGAGVCVFAKGGCVDLIYEVSGCIESQGVAYRLWGEALYSVEDHDDGGLILGVCDGGVLEGGENAVYGVVDGIVVIFGVVFVVGGGAVDHGFWNCG
jgi:hypothetical protein